MKAQFVENYNLDYLLFEIGGFFLSAATLISWIKGLLLVNPKATVELILHIDTIWIVSQNNGGLARGKPFPKSDKEGKSKIFIWYLKPERTESCPMS